MSTLIDLTVGDTGVTISGTITQKQLKSLQQSDLASVKFSLLRQQGTPIVNEAVATLGTLDTVAGSVPVSYRLQAADVAVAEPNAFVRWTLVLADSGKIHAPGGQDAQTLVRINP